MDIVLITGGSSGIGFQTVLNFHQAGYKVITCARSEDKWNGMLAKHPELSGVDFLAVDLQDVHQIARLFDYIKNSYGHINIAVNNASPHLKSRGTFSEVPVDALYHTMIGDFWIHALCLHYELRMMPPNGSVVNVSAVSGQRPSPNIAMYAAMKHALEGLTRTVALEAIRKKIRVNAIAPGVVWTPRWEKAEKDLQQKLYESVVKNIPNERFATTTEIADAIIWLCSKQAEYIVGHTLVMDGGLGLT